MRSTIVLIGFQDQGNLGIGYLTAALASRGYTVEILDFRADPETILAEIEALQPILVGFSLIFQYYLSEYAALAAYLRAHHVDCHFTVGGHYPSLSHEDVLNKMPSLDSVVRFEGELTLLELVDCLVNARDWRGLQGIAYRDEGTVVSLPLRPLIRDLDELPLPDRPAAPEHILGRKALPILGSRGCAHTCSFCSIHTFYRAVPGKVVRTREPVRIVAEMKQLYEERGVEIFLFQDDDFPLWGKAGPRWANAILDELHRQDLVGKVIWKISCRAEYVEPELFGRLRAGGLYLVYMGLESGTETGLAVLNKRISVEQNLRAVAVLKELNLMFEYGFMLFDPSSTFSSVRENIAFLRRIIGDGSAAAIFCRMLPYGGTPIMDQLAREGRLKGDVINPDYDFLDPRLNAYFDVLNEAAAGWIGSDGVSPRLNWAWHEVTIVERLFPPVVGLRAYQEQLRALTRSSNELLFRTVEESALAWEADARYVFSTRELAAACQDTRLRLERLRNAFVVRNQETLLDALAAAERPDGATLTGAHA